MTAVTEAPAVPQARRPSVHVSAAVARQRAGAAARIVELERENAELRAALAVAERDAERAVEDGRRQERNSAGEDDERPGAEHLDDAGRRPVTEQCRNCEWSGDTDDLRWSSKCCDAEREDSNRCPECNKFASWNAVCPRCGGGIETAAARAKREAELKRERNKPPLHFVTWLEGKPWPRKALCGAAIEEDSDDWDYSPSPHMVDGKVHSTVEEECDDFIRPVCAECRAAAIGTSARSTAAEHPTTPGGDR